MKIRILASVVLGALAVGAERCPAQEKPEPVPAPERIAPPTEQAPVVVAPPVPCGPACAPKPGYKYLWVERDVPIQVLIPREVTTTTPSKTFEIAYREEKRVVVEMVLQPREVDKVVTVCSVKPVTVTDPCTGKCSTVLQPCHETKVVKETQFVAVPTKRELIEQVPYLKLVDTVVAQQNIILEWRTEMKKVGEVVKVPCPDEVPPPRYLLAPKPPCPQ